MSNVEFMASLNDINNVIVFIKISIIVIFTFKLFRKIINEKMSNNKKILIEIISIPIIATVALYEKSNNDYFLEILLLILLMSIVNIINYSKEYIYTLILTMISYVINYSIYMISITLAFIPNAILRISNDYIALSSILIVYVILFFIITNIKKFKHGISFLQKRLDNTFFNTTILNIVVILLFFAMTIQDRRILRGKNIIITFIFLSITLFITIKQSLQLYYKQKLLTKDLEETKTELEAKNKEINKLEKENLEYGKRSHSLAHKQKALEFKLENLMKTQIDEESKKSIKEEIVDLNKEVYKEPGKVELAKTGIEVIDNMLSYMQSECIKDNIEFELQVLGNIYYMINNLITENDLEILIADHIKDAIFAINFSDNSNRSILVRIGKIDNIYSLYIYDSGIEFSKEVLDNIGKKPITTHEETGGTGMGFMNTFDTLNKTKASFIINEIGKPCEDNYTKVLIFKFDNKNEFKVNSYKSYKDEVLAHN